jgi:hypothetical protein
MDFHQQLDKTLKDLRVTHNTVVKVEDILQDLEVEISIVHKYVFDPSLPQVRGSQRAHLVVQDGL